MNLEKLKARIAEFQAREDELIARQNAATSDRLRFELERLRRCNEIRFHGFLETERLNELLGQTELPDTHRQRAA